MNKITYLIGLLICSCLALVSCQDDQDDVMVPGAGAGVRVAFSTPDFVQLGTRATSESSIKDITVLQFKDGKLVKQLFLEDKLFSQQVELEGLESIPAATINEDKESVDYGKLIQNGSENLLVFLANVKHATGTGVTGFTLNSSTYKDLLAYTASLADADALAGLQYMPMTGTYLKGITDGVTNQINVTLTRALAKINFTLNTTNFTLPSGETPEIVVNSIELHNVPTQIAFFPGNRPALPANGLPGEWPDMQTPYPVATGSGSAAADGGIDADNFVTLTAVHNQSTNVQAAFVGYMPENARGSYENITNNKQKIPASITTAANRIGLTYLLVDLDYATSNGVIRNATYRIYLGGDAAGDMNLLANTQYNVTTYLYGDGSGAADVDTRITVSDVFNPSVTNSGSNSLQGPANSYIINPQTVGADKPNFTIPLTQARNGWRYIHASLKADGDATDYTQKFDDMIATNWTIETLWKTWQGSNVTGTLASGITTASGAATNRYYATLTIPSDIPLGNNAVIALKDVNGDTWWTWHLWITDYNPDATIGKNGQTHTYISDAFGVAGLHNGKKMMDRNLGAMITGITDSYTQAQPQTTTEAVKWYGLMYQWGRKDPFTNSSNGTTTQNMATPIYDSSDIQITTESDGFPKISNNSSAINNLANATHNPMNYYHSGLNSDWTKADNNLWETSSKTPFDPCPAGWRVPVGGATATNNPWAGFSDGGSSSVANVNPYNAATAGNIFDWYAAASGQSGTTGRLYDKNGTTAWYPAVGFRNAATGLFSYMGSYSGCWSSTFTGTNGYLQYFGVSDVYPARSFARAYGYSIRCIQQ